MVKTELSKRNNNLPMIAQREPYVLAKLKDTGWSTFESGRGHTPFRTGNHQVMPSGFNTRCKNSFPKVE